MAKQISFRIEDSKAKQLDEKLLQTGISKQFLFNKLIETFLNDQIDLSCQKIENNSIEEEIDYKELIEQVKYQLLPEIQDMVANQIKCYETVASNNDIQDLNCEKKKEFSFESSKRLIKRRTKEGITKHNIAKELNQKGYPTIKGRKGNWRSNSVERVLRILYK